MHVNNLLGCLLSASPISFSIRFAETESVTFDRSSHTSTDTSFYCDTAELAA